MSAFQNMRTRCLSKSWPSVFVKSGKFASAFVDLSDTGVVAFIEAHGSQQEAGDTLRKRFIQLGVMQDGPGAPAGNANARAENRVKTKAIENAAKLAVMEVVAGGKKRLAAQVLGLTEMKVQSAIDRVVDSTKALDAALKPKVLTLQSTTKLIDGKPVTSVKRVIDFAKKNPLTDTSTKKKGRKATKTEIKRSHHKKPLAKDAGGKPSKRSHKKSAGSGGRDASKKSHHAHRDATTKRRSHHKKEAA